MNNQQIEKDISQIAIRHISKMFRKRCTSLECFHDELIARALNYCMMSLYNDQ